MDTTALKTEALNLLKGALAQVKPTPEDQVKIADYTLGYGEALMAGQKDSAMGYLDGLNLTLAKYALKAEAAREKFIFDAISAAARIGIAALAA